METLLKSYGIWFTYKTIDICNYYLILYMYDDK